MTLFFCFVYAKYTQERAKAQRNFEYQVLQNKLENSDKNKKIEWWVDKNEPDIKPYSVSSSQLLKSIIILVIINDTEFCFKLKNKKLSKSTKYHC